MRPHQTGREGRKGTSNLPSFGEGLKKRGFLQRVTRLGDHFISLINATAKSGGIPMNFPFLNQGIGENA